jgi:hypothetical protein
VPVIISNEIPTINKIPNDNPHNNKAFPFGLYWNIIKPQIAKNQITRISNPLNNVIILKLNNKVLAIENININAITKMKTTGNKYLSSIFLNIL